MGPFWFSFCISGLTLLNAWIADRCFKKGEWVQGALFTGFSVLGFFALVAKAVSA